MAKKQFPAWRYGPNGAAKIFNTEEEVPEGWAKHPNLVGKEPSGGSKAEDPEGALKAEYERLTGEKAGRKQAKTLQEGIDKVRSEQAQFFKDAETTPEEVRELLAEMDVKLPEEGDTAALIALAKEHLVEDDD